MKKTLLALIVMLLLSINMIDAKPAASATKVDPAFEQFWKDFQAAVAKGDKGKIEEMTNFPMKTYEGNEPPSIEQSKEELGNAFGKKIKASIKKTNASSLKQQIEQGESVYVLVLNYGDFAETFYFALRKGVYKLIRIDFAG